MLERPWWFRLMCLFVDVWMREEDVVKQLVL